MQKICPNPFLHNRQTKFYETSYLNSLEQCVNTFLWVFQYEAASGKKWASCKKLFFTNIFFCPSEAISPQPPDQIL